jgi:hypothetical protein
MDQNSPFQVILPVSIEFPVSGDSLYIKQDYFWMVQEDP